MCVQAGCSGLDRDVVLKRSAAPPRCSQMAERKANDFRRGREGEREREEP